MTKTFRRALACLLAVLMVACSMPFTALAACTPNRAWWIDDGLETVTEEMPYSGLNSDDYGLSYEVGQRIGLDDDAEDIRDEYKPVLAVIVSSVGENGMAPGAGGLSDYYNKYYGYSKSLGYNKAAKILNPADLKAGQRIAVTVEMGGVDAWFNAQIKGTYDNHVLESAYYSKSPTAKNGDTWAPTGNGGTTAAKLYSGLSSTGAATDQTFTDTYGTWYSNQMNEFSASGTDDTASSYLGNADERGFGKYGFTMATFFFEVKEDCDLKDVFWFATDKFGTICEVFERSTIDDQYFNITIDETDTTFARFAPVIWDSYEKTSTPEVPHTHDYQLTSTTDATCTADAVKHYTCTNTDGKCDVLTKDETVADSALGHNFAGTVTANAAEGKHTVKCTRCDETTLVACSYTSTTIGADCTKPGTIVYTCACGDTYSETTGTALGHDMQVVKEEITKAATCEDDGTKTISYKCSRCDATDTKTKTIKKLGHDLSSATVTTPATCTADGSKVTTTTCSRCDYEDVKTETITKLGHDLSSNTVTTPATCTADGSKVTTTTCSRCDYKDVQTEVLEKLGHDLTTNVVTVDATYDAAGSVTTTTTCSRCDYVDEDVQVIPMLEGVKVTVTPSALGTATVKGIDVVDDAVTANCAPNSDVVLTATAGANAEFVGWSVDGKLVAADTTITVKALADITYVPVFEEAGSTFTVVFADRYGNIFATQNVKSGAEVDFDAVKAPTVAGYTFAGWSVTAEEITGPTTVMAVYEKAAAAGYTVTADGCTITAGDVTAEGKLEGVAYDTLVTVTADGAKAWTINGATVAYGESYTFYVGSDVTVVPVKDAVTATPTVAAVSVTEITDGAKIKASFLATRSMTDDCKYVSAGFVYGKNLASTDITLDDVKAGSAVKAYYCATDAEQFALTYSLAAQQGTMTARAFLAYVNAQGETVVIYAEPQTYTYA